MEFSALQISFIITIVLLYMVCDTVFYYNVSYCHFSNFCGNRFMIFSNIFVHIEVDHVNSIHVQLKQQLAMLTSLFTSSIWV